MTFRSDGKATLRSPFTVDTDDLFYGKAFDALDQLLAAPKHDKFRRISQAVHQHWRTATDRTSRTRAYRISSEAAQHADVSAQQRLPKRAQSRRTEGIGLATAMVKLRRCFAYFRGLVCLPLRSSEAF